jgi:hypothetical protein
MRKVVLQTRRRRKGKIEFEESAMSVSCTLRLQRRILRNLRGAARSKIDLQLAKRAEQLLAATEPESRPAAVAAGSDRVTVTTPAQAIAPPTAVPVTGVSRVRRWATATLSKCVSRVSAFVKQKFSLRPAHAG